MRESDKFSLIYTTYSENDVNRIKEAAGQLIVNYSCSRVSAYIHVAKKKKKKTGQKKGFLAVRFAAAIHNIIF